MLISADNIIDWTHRTCVTCSSVRLLGMVNLWTGLAVAFALTTRAGEGGILKPVVAAH